MPQSEQGAETKKPHQEFGTLRQVSSIHRDSWWWRDPYHVPHNSKPDDKINGGLKIMSYGEGHGLNVHMTEQRKDAAGRYKHRILNMELGPDAKRALFRHLLEDPDMIAEIAEVQRSKGPNFFSNEAARGKADENG